MPTKHAGQTLLNPQGRKAWRENGPTGGQDLWEMHGVWEWDSTKNSAAVPREDYFVNYPATGRKVALFFPVSGGWLGRMALTMAQIDWYTDFYYPFLKKWTERVRRAVANERGHEKLFFVEPVPNEVHRTDIFGRKFWFSGTESFVFNKLEEIALLEEPTMPALGCGITHALSKRYLPAEFGADYMTSRINWVVQSSGVDYLHLLIVSMEYLIQTYSIDARYLVSVHDELRYLVTEQDRYRAALALQIANLWTRCLFVYRLGMDDLPQGIAFFSAVDVDSVLRKEMDMPCATPSQSTPVPPGESLGIEEILARTGGTLWADGRLMEEPEEGSDKARRWDPLVGYVHPDCLRHRTDSAAWFRARATNSFAEVKASRATGVRYQV
jgi:DNA polymerase family A